MKPTLYVTKLDPRGLLPTVAHPGEDLAYDLYSIEDATLIPGEVQRLRTGIAIEMQGYGFLIRERSSMALSGIITVGGTIDAGYRGEMFVNLYRLPDYHPYYVKAGDRIAQFLPFKLKTDGKIVEVKKLSISSRSSNGYGSTGR